MVSGAGGLCLFLPVLRPRADHRGIDLALPIFVLVYVRVYGGNWRLCVALAAMISGFIFGIYDQIMHVY